MSVHDPVTDLAWRDYLWLYNYFLTLEYFILIIRYTFSSFLILIRETAGKILSLTGKRTIIVTDVKTGRQKDSDFWWL